MAAFKKLSKIKGIGPRVEIMFFHFQGIHLYLTCPARCVVIGFKTRTGNTSPGQRGGGLYGTGLLSMTRGCFEMVKKKKHPILCLSDKAVPI